MTCRKKKSPFGRDLGGLAANRVSSHLIMLVHILYKCDYRFVDCDHYFSFRRKSPMVLNHLHWSSVYTFADHHCSQSRRRAANGSKRMYLDDTRGLFIT
jgi:hypothetical protein